MRLLFFILLALPVSLTAQPVVTAAEPKSKLAPVNQTDKRGQKQGMWYIQQPERMGEDAFSEFGNYVAGRKTGLWYHMDNSGQITSIEQFRNNVLDGEVKYFENNRLIAAGHYRGLNPDQEYDTIFVEHPVTGVEKLTVIPTERGSIRHGLWRFYDARTGRLIREEDYQADELVFRKEFSIANADSAYYAERDKRLPHNTKRIYQPPAAKRHHYYND